MKKYILKLWDNLQTSYWFVPSIMIAIAVLCWIGTNTLDQNLSTREEKVVAWLYIDEVAAMRTMVFTVAGTIIGIVGVVFSILMVPLTIAASQFGPRLLRTFLRDTGTQVTLGTFTATFIFCMLVLVQLRDQPDYSLPQISANVVLLLGIISFGVLIYFISHVANSLQAPVVVARVKDELLNAIEDEFPVFSKAAAEHSVPSQVDHPMQYDQTKDLYPVVAKSSGYVQLRDDQQLLQIAKENNAVIQVLFQPGDFIVKGVLLAKVWASKPRDKERDDSINEAFILGRQRTLVQDVTFGINELVEVAIRALSPAINDPFTAMTCLDWLGTVLCKVCTRILPSTQVFDGEGQLRLIRVSVSFTSLTDAAFNQIREYGRTSAAVTMRMMDTIAAIAQCARTEEQRAALRHHALLVERGSVIGLPEKADQKVIESRYQAVLNMLE
jgi:uncharacterized membrane protein